LLRFASRSPQGSSERCVVADAFIPIYPNTLPTVPKPSKASRTASLVVNNLEASQSAITRLLNRCPFMDGRNHPTSIPKLVGGSDGSSKPATACVTRRRSDQSELRPRVPEPATDGGEKVRISRTSGLRLYRLARIFGKFLANGFFSGRPGTGKSENDHINTGD
jgi:hypothetical protein